MQVLPIDLTGLVAVILGISTVLVPIIGLTARFALKPTVEALSKFFEAKGQEETVAILERRQALLEAQVEQLEAQLRRIAETSEFDRQLAAGGGATAEAAGRPQAGAAG